MCTLLPPESDSPCDRLTHRVTVCLTCRTAGLLRFLESGERTPAQQPAGLSVQMRQYQLQSLKFMLDAEAREGGYRWGLREGGPTSVWLQVEVGLDSGTSSSYGRRVN